MPSPVSFAALGLFYLPGMLLFGAAPDNAASPPPAMSAGAGSFEFQHADKTVPVWYYLPANVNPDTPVVIVMHGVNRDAKRYRDDWQPLAQKHPFLLVVPEFSKDTFPGESYPLGETTGSQSREHSSYRFIEPLFDAVKTATGNHSASYLLYGHSAGAQFVHRFLYFVPEARVTRAVAANAGWWLLPDPAVKFPYGLRDSDVSDTMLKTMLQRPLVVLLGTADTDSNAENLRETAEAKAQGPNRFQRGHTFFESGKHRAGTLGVPFGWKLETVEGVAHHDSGMAAAAVQWLFTP